jgi:hypothetical protein
MNSIARLAAAGLALTWLVACGSPTPHEPAAEQDDAGPASDVEARHGTKDETVFDDMIRTEDKARSVEGTIMQGKADTDAAIEAAESGGTPDQGQEQQ